MSKKVCAIVFSVAAAAIVGAGLLLFYKTPASVPPPGPAVSFDASSQKNKQDLSRRPAARVAPEADPNTITAEGNELSDAQAYQMIINNTAERYKELKGQPGVIWGRLNLGKIKTPITMRLAKTGDIMGPKLTVAPEGYFVFGPLPTGSYELVAYETAETPGIRYENYALDGGKPQDELVLSGGSAAIKVKIVDETGGPLGGVKIIVGKAAGLSGSKSSVFTFRNGTSDANGEYTAADLTDGKYTVMASFANTADAGTVLDLAPTATQEVKLELRLHGAQLRGFVRDATGRGLGGIRLMMAGGKDCIKSSETAPTGEFVFSAVPKGKYVISAEGNESYLGDVMNANIEEENSNSAPVTFVLHPRTSAASVHGAVVAPLGNVQYFVSVEKPDGTVIASGPASPKDGSFIIDGLYPGKFTLRLLRPNGLSPSTRLASATIEITENTRLIEGLKLTPQE